MHYPELDPDPEYENNTRRARMYPHIRTKMYYSGEEHMAYVNTNHRYVGEATQHAGNVTAMIVPPVMNLGYLQSLR